MNIHSIHFEEGIKPRLRSAGDRRQQQEASKPQETFVPAQKDEAKAELDRWRELQNLTCRH